MTFDTTRHRTALSPDLYQRGYHFYSPTNFLNDPHVLIDDGTGHLFYQHKPSGPNWGLGHWGHASSADLLHWRDYPLALGPTPGSADADSCMSGSVVVDGSTAVALYTGPDGEGER